MSNFVIYKNYVIFCSEIHNILREQIMNSRVFGIKKSWRNRFRAFMRKKLNPILQDIKWPLLGLIWVIALTLGYIGFKNHALAAGRYGTGFDYFYRTLQLIVLQSGDVAGIVPWQLDAARFLLPVLAGYTAIHAFVAIFRYQWQLLRTFFFRNHLVICGLGERGMRLAEEFLEHGYQVAVIEEDGDNPMLEQIRRLGAVVLIGDATDLNVLGKARIHRAKYLITVCADDGTNAEIALKACDRVRSYHDRVLTAFVHIFDLDLCNLLSGWSLTAAAEIDSFRLELFNVPARGARLMLKEHSPFDDENEASQKQPCLTVIGLGKMGRSLVILAAQKWWMKHADSGRKLKIIAIDRAVNRKIELLRMQYPGLDRACKIDARQIDTDDPDFESGSFLFNTQGGCDTGIIYICFDNDVHALVSALKMYRKTVSYGVPIIVRMNRDAGLATLINSEYSSPDFSYIHTFNFLDKTCSIETVLGGTHEILARVIHENYVNHQKSSGLTVQDNPSMVKWDDLPEDLKESNRYQASRIEEKLKAVGCGIQPLTDWEAAGFAFTPDEIEIMAEIEHKRWCAERFMQGWSFSKSAKDLKKKTSPHLVPWSELSEDVKGQDRNTVKEMAAFLALAGLQICRKFHIEEDGLNDL